MDPSNVGPTTALVNGTTGTSGNNGPNNKGPLRAAGAGSHRGPKKATRTKNRGSQTCSSDEDDLHSDDNLRPYEEVKVAHHDKKLAGLGLTPDESSVSPIISNSAVPVVKPTPQRKDSSSHNNHSHNHNHNYPSDEEAEARVPLQGKSAAAYQLQQNHQHPPPPHHFHPHHHHHPHYPPNQPPTSQQQQQQQHQHLCQSQQRPSDFVVYDPPWDHINFDPMRNPNQHRSAHASESDEDNRQAMQRYSQSGTLPMPPPTFPPPPPPRIEDIPQRSPAVHRQRSFGPSTRGNYSETDFRRPQNTYSEGGDPHELENPYMVQNALVAAYPMDGRCPHQRPPMHRSGSVPSGHGHGMADGGSDHYISSGHSDTYPYHCPASIGAPGEAPVSYNNDRQVVGYPPFGVPPTSVPPTGSYAPSSDYRYYSKFSSAGTRMKKKLGQRCTWKCTAIILLIMCVALLACTLYFAVRSMGEEKKMECGKKECDTQYFGSTNGGFPGTGKNQTSGRGNLGHKTQGTPTGSIAPTTLAPTPLQPGRPSRKSVAPGTFWVNKLDQRIAGNIKLNLTVPPSAMVGVYGRRGMAPTHAQFDFFKVIDGNRVGGGDGSFRSKRSLRSSDYFARDTALVEYLDKGSWFIAIYNDRDTYQSIQLMAEPQQMDTGCDDNCHGNGQCEDGKCHCFPGYSGRDCAQSACPILCSGNGIYHRGQCQCNDGWKGDECERRESECAAANCNDNGHCINGQCVCFTGYKGPDCGIVDCHVPGCSGNGMCELGTCRCFRGFKGDDCSHPDKINVTQLCSRSCSGHGLYDVGTDKCECFHLFSGVNCETEICLLQCIHGRCENQKCVCDEGWTGTLCDQRQCDRRCELQGYCNNGTCVCEKGWNGKHCTINGCPSDCSNHGICRMRHDGWSCECRDRWKGEACDKAMETSCDDRVDNDHDGLMDCLDPDCCPNQACAKSQWCRASPDPREILLGKDAPSPTASFLDKMRFLIEENSVQMDAPRNSFNETQVSVIRGRVHTMDGTPLVGVRVGIVTQPLYGYTLTRKEGLFDILVNGGGSVTLEFVRDPFVTKISSVLVPWNQIITMDTVPMTTETRAELETGSTCGNLESNHDHFLLRPVVLSTWQHTQLGACPEGSTIIPESQVLQESLDIPGTDVHLVYHSSESSGYMSLIMIQMTPEDIPYTLALVHLRVTVQGVIFEKTFEADPNLKYTFAWNRLNAYKQKVYGIVRARVHVGYQYLSCAYVYWETRSATLNGYDMKASHIGGWNLDIHHTYNHQEGILHKGDGTNIYLKEKPKKIINILGSGHQRNINCEACNGKAHDNGLLSPVALASGLDGSLYVADYNFIRKLSPYREEIASILQMSTYTTPYKFYMAVSPVDGKLYISDMMSHKVIRIRTMGPVPDLADNYEVVAGNGEECPPGDAQLCGDGGLAVNARLRYPKGIAITKDGITYIADGPNIRKITPDGIISTLIGKQDQPGDWTPMPCDEILAAEKVSLKWPTALAINPLDDSLHILDHSIVLKLTSDFKLVTIAGRPVYCPPRDSSFLPSGVLADDEQASNVADHVTLMSPKSLTFGPHGDLYIVESNTHHINRVRVVSTDGHIHHFAGAKSKCDCSQTEKCACYNPQETLAAQALFSVPTSVTVTPDGVLHLADSGNLRVFSVVSELPMLTDRMYEVMSPETQELYLFNMYGQHRHTVNIHTDHYVYNFTYNVFSPYSRLESVEDAAQNKIKMERDYRLHVKEIISPGGEVCSLEMDNRDRLHHYVAPDQSSSTFTYTDQTGLLESKHDSDGQTFLYHYDMNGRLLTVRQPTGQLTTLSTDINTTGTIVRVATGTHDIRAMATYGRVHSVLHGNTQTKVTYLPDGAVVVLFPSNLTVAIETGRHPTMANENRMYYKRKVIVPGSSVHRLEWRFYTRRQRPGGPSRSEFSKLGQRMRVGDRGRTHVVHDSLGGMGKSKALLINGANMLTVEYDRRSHTETVQDKSLRDIMTVVYNSVGQPVQFIPASSHHGMNVTYDTHGDITEWQYGGLVETRKYKEPGLIKERTLKPGGKKFRYFYRDNARKLTDVFLPSGKQYLFEHNELGHLEHVVTPSLGYHHFNTLLTLGMKRYLYRAPLLNHPYIQDFDAMGKLLQVTFPSEYRRVVYKYNNLGQRSTTIFDQTFIRTFYHPEAQQVSKSSLISRGYANTLKFKYMSSLIQQCLVTFPQDSSLVGASFEFGYDNNFRQTETTVKLTNNMSLSSNRSYSSENGKLSSVGNMNVEWVTEAKQVFTTANMVLTREYDRYGKLTHVLMRFGKKTIFDFHIDYDKIGRVHEWKTKVKDGKESKVEYIYDVDNHMTEVLLQGKTVWEFGYDPDGNIFKMTSQGKTRHMEFDAGDKITMMGGVTYKFDNDGLMAQRGMDHVTFNSAGQLIAIKRHGMFKYSFFYDAFGRFTVQRDRHGRMLQYFYSDMKQKHHITHVYNHTSGELTEYFRDASGSLLSMQRGGKTFYIMVDPSQSPILVFNKDGEVVKQMRYNPLGVLELDSDPNFDFAFGFQGNVYNPITHLVHFPDRVYDANLGRFLTPDYHAVFDKLRTVAEDPEILNLYSHRYLVNTHLRNQVYPRLDLNQWLYVLGYDVRSMSPDVSYTGDLNPGPSPPSMQLLPAASAFECTFRRDMHNLLSISTVPTSKVTPLQSLPPETPTPMKSIFGPGVTISDIAGKAVVNLVDVAESWAKNLATVLLNSSQILPHHFTIKGKDTHYFVKSSAKEAEENLRSLGIHSNLVTYESGINVSIHRNKHGRGSYGASRREVDIRIHSNGTTLNIRYGTTLDREKRRVLHHAKDRAVTRAWDRERYLIKHSLPSFYQWTEEQAQQISNTGYMPGYVADYINPPDEFPEIADDCNNIRIVPEVP